MKSITKEKSVLKWSFNGVEKEISPELSLEELTEITNKGGHILRNVQKQINTLQYKKNMLENISTFVEVLTENKFKVKAKENKVKTKKVTEND